MSFSRIVMSEACTISRPGDSRLISPACSALPVDLATARVRQMRILFRVRVAVWTVSLVLVGDGWRLLRRSALSEQPQ